jgi:hypothetical protein
MARDEVARVVRLSPQRCEINKLLLNPGYIPLNESATFKVETGRQISHLAGEENDHKAHRNEP